MIRLSDLFFLSAKGELIGCFGLTEPNHGSDPAGKLTKIPNSTPFCSNKKVKYLYFS